MEMLKKIKFMVFCLVIASTSLLYGDSEAAPFRPNALSVMNFQKRNQGKGTSQSVKSSSVPKSPSALPKSSSAPPPKTSAISKPKSPPNPSTQSPPSPPKSTKQPETKANNPSHPNHQHGPPANPPSPPSPATPPKPAPPASPSSNTGSHNAPPGETRDQQKAREATGHEQAKKEQQSREAAGHAQARQEQQAREAAGHEQAKKEQQSREAAGHEQARKEQQQREAAGHAQARQEQQQREAAGHEQAKKEQQAREAAGHEQAKKEQQAREAADHGQSVSGNQDHQGHEPPSNTDAQQGHGGPKESGEGKVPDGAGSQMGEHAGHGSESNNAKQPPGSHDHGDHQPKTGDFPFFNPGASGHQGHEHHGRPLNKGEQDSVFKKMNMPPSSEMTQRLDKIGAFNPGQPAPEKEAATYLAMNTLAKFDSMPASKFKNEKEASEAYGALKTAGKDGDAAGIRENLKKYGGSDKGLSDEQLVNLWGANEHQNLHGSLFGNENVRDAVHATSLSDNNGADPSKKNLGGFNDKGTYPQWGWFEAAKKYPSLLGE